MAKRIPANRDYWRGDGIVTLGEITRLSRLRIVGRLAGRSRSIKPLRPYPLTGRIKNRAVSDPDRPRYLKMTHNDHHQDEIYCVYDGVLESQRCEPRQWRPFHSRRR